MGCSLNPSAHLERLTPGDRVRVRDELYSPHCALSIFPVADVWACDVEGIVFEAASVGDLLRLLADVAEEC